MHPVLRPLALVGVLASGGLVAAACATPVGDPRPQLVVIVDTDAIVQSVVAADPTISAAAALDTLRVDAIPADGSNTAYDLRTFIAPDVQDWPLSFGVAADEADAGPVRLRLRIFAGRLADSGELAGQATLDPPPTVTIDRLIDVVPPTEGIKTVKVTLHQDCLGVSTRFTDPPETCVDGARRQASPSEGVDEVDDAASKMETEAGTWEPARELPCTTSAPPGMDAVCIPGGFDVLGNESFVAVSRDYYDALPYRAVLLSPFWMDRTEMTVGRLKALRDAGRLEGIDLPLAFDSPDPNGLGLKYCTWENPALGDAYPVNCMSNEAAAEICAVVGGTLPSEAQWDHAASGRGLGRLYPWGNEVPECCTTSVSRHGQAGIPTECGGSGTEPVGSHPLSESCEGLGDVSLDGVFDLAGSVNECLRDVPQGFDAPCWKPTAGLGILVDPVCTVTDALNRSSRGGSWPSGRLTTAVPFRSSTGTGPTSGFRCVYPGGQGP